MGLMIQKITLACHLPFFQYNFFYPDKKRCENLVEVHVPTISTISQNTYNLYTKHVISAYTLSVLKVPYNILTKKKLKMYNVSSVSVAHNTCVNALRCSLVWLYEKIWTPALIQLPDRTSSNLYTYTLLPWFRIYITYTGSCSGVTYIFFNILCLVVVVVTNSPYERLYKGHKCRVGGIYEILFEE